MVIEITTPRPGGTRHPDRINVMYQTISTETVTWIDNGKTVKVEFTLSAEHFQDVESNVSGDTGRRHIDIDLTYGDEIHRDVSIRPLTAAEKAQAPAGAAGAIWRLGLMQDRYDEIMAARARIEAHPEWVEYQASIKAGHAAQRKYDELQARMRLQDGV